MLDRRRILLERLLTGAVLVLAAGLLFAGRLALAPRRGPSIEPPDRPPARAGEPAGSIANLAESDLAPLWEGLDPARPAPAPDLPPPSKAEGKADISLPFKVAGIVYAEGDGSVAFIETPDGTGIFRRGDAVGEWVLAAISQRSVTLTREGEERILGLALPSYGTGAYVPRATAARPSAAGTARAGASATRGGLLSGRKPSWERPASASAGGTRARGPSSVRPRDVDRTVGVAAADMDRIRQDPWSAVQGVRIQPHIVDGFMHGIHVLDVPQRSLAARYGLQPGDRILAVNSQTIDAPERVISILERYRNDDSLRVTIERGGQRMELGFYIR